MIVMFATQPQNDPLQDLQLARKDFQQTKKMGSIFSSSDGSMEATSRQANIYYIKQLVQGKRNVAMYQDASQSTTVVYKGLGVASSAVDGNTDPYFKIGSVTATEDGECNPWWMVKLDKIYTIHSVELHNRLDSCCSERLANFTVELLTPNGNSFITTAQVEGTGKLVGAAGLIIFPSGSYGSIVRVSLRSCSPLSLAEVMVYETESSTDTIEINLLKSKVDVELEAKETELRVSSLKFYLYDGNSFTFEKNLAPNRASFKRYLGEILFDEALLTILKRSTFRTADSKIADVFVPAIPFSRLTNLSHKKTVILPALEDLINNEVFKENSGHRHVFIGTSFCLFRKDCNFAAVMIPYMHHFVNTTLAMSWDPNAVSTAVKEGHDFKEYQKTFESYGEPFTHTSISLGLNPQPNPSIISFPKRIMGATHEITVPIRIASMTKWSKASNFIFYQVKNSNFFNNSTIYRTSPLIKSMEMLPKSKIGWGIESPKEFVEELLDSKFCLVIRGDSPHSKSFLRSIRAGCIPVVVSDCLPIYSPVMKSTLNMTDYSIMLDETRFVENPEAELLSLLDLSEETIEAKLKHLAFAQKVTMLDHPDSLFVPAFLREAVNAFHNNHDNMATENFLVTGGGNGEVVHKF